MEYKYPELEAQFDSVHPLVHNLIEVDLAAFLLGKKYRGTVVTHVFRTEEQSEEIYWKRVKLMAKGALDEAAARKQARLKFSWHKVWCATDIRNSHYTYDQIVEIVAFLKVAAKKRAPQAVFEILSHDVSAGNHIHVGVRDESWRKKFAKQ